MMPRRLDAETTQEQQISCLDQAQWVITTVGAFDANLALLHGLRAAGYDGRVAFTGHDPIEAARLRDDDVDVVIAPFAVAAERLVDQVLVSPAKDG